MAFFSKKKEGDSVESRKNWYSDRYQSVLVQRNFLLLLTLISLAGIMFSVMAVIQVTSSKSIEPFVIEIEEKTGITNVIRPLLRDQFAYDETLRRYFLTKYMNTRETYDSGSFQYNYYTVVRLLSAGDVYARFKRSISPSNKNSPLLMGSRSQKTIKIKSITPLKTAPGQSGFTTQVRFLSSRGGRNRTYSKHLVATINFDYFDLSLTNEQRAVNPLGFQVTGYRIDEESL